MDEDAVSNPGFNSLLESGKLLASRQVPSEYVQYMSETSDAKECFINQRFSRRLQAFLISYAYSITSGVPLI